MQIKRGPDLGKIADLPARFGPEFALDLYKRGDFCRRFENKVKEAYDRKLLSLPVYLSFGTEFNSAAFSKVLDGFHIFAQHRCHSLYLNFGGKPEALRDELFGLPTGCSGGMSGSNAIQAPEARMIGHSGLMGEQVPIAVGAALASGEPCLTICGDASVEEDFIYPSLGWAATKKLPVLFVCEDNDLSILTKVEVRRSWSAVSLARSFGLPAIDIADDPWLIAHHARELARELPAFINIRTVRNVWHAGTGNDGPPEWDRFALVQEELRRMGLQPEMSRIEHDNQDRAEALWQERLPKR